MKTIDVCLSPDLIHLYPLENTTVVVVDILRATSCMVTAFAHGVDHIKTFASLEECLALKSEGYLTAGERDGKKVAGFDFGNSPFEYMHHSTQGKYIAFTTTNGTQAIAKSAEAKEIVIGAFLNLQAVANYLLQQANNVLIVCAGWKGKVNLEDTLFAGALVSLLETNFQLACDAPLAAQHLYTLAKADLVKFLEPSSHVKRLAKLNIFKDIEFCLTANQYTVVPVLKDDALRV